MGKRRLLTAAGPRHGTWTTRSVIGREVTLGTRRLYYTETGFGAPVLLIHGYGASSRWWFPLFPSLTAAGFRLVACDLPGFGHSPGPPLSLEKTARLLVDLMERLGYGRFFVCGHSMGGLLGIRLASDFGARTRRLVLIDSAGIPDGIGRRVMGRLLKPWAWCPSWFYPTLIGTVLRSSPRSLLSYARELRRYDVRPSLERVRVPVLLVWGGRDRLTPPEHAHTIAAALPDSRLEILPEAQHLPMVSDPDRVASGLISFLSEAVG